MLKTKFFYDDKNLEQSAESDTDSTSQPEESLGQKKKKYADKNIEQSASDSDSEDQMI